MIFRLAILRVILFYGSIRGWHFKILETETDWCTVADMHSVIQSALDELVLDNTSDIRTRVLDRSSGSFIWVKLVLQELETAFTNEDVEEILHEVPDDLSDMYERVLLAIEKDKRRAKIAKSILLWVTLAVRPLNIEELQHAVQLDLGQAPQKMEQTIMLCCGQLVTIDQNRRVHIVHETAREFLLREGLSSPLAISRFEGHSHIASMCISYLDELFLNRNTFKSSALDSATTQRNVLRQYTSTAFSRHVLESNPGDRKLFGRLLKFMDDRVLFWVEVIAEDRDLAVISRTSIDLATYLDQLVHNYSAPETQRLKDWVADLSRIAISFRTQLHSSPDAIYDLIPPLCPPFSLISRKFGNLPTSFNVQGLHNPTWSDCYMQIIADWPLNSVAFGKKYFALGSAVGEISIYDATFLQHYIDVKHLGETVYQLKFGCQDKYLASMGNDFVMIWDPKSGTLLHEISCSSSCPMAMSFSNDSLTIALKRGCIISWYAFQQLFSYVYFILSADNCEVTWLRGRLCLTDGFRT